VNARGLLSSQNLAEVLGFSNAKLRVSRLLSAEKSALENLFIVAIAELIRKHGLTAYFSSVILIGCQFM
jgi:hypothetical protein